MSQIDQTQIRTKLERNLAALIDANTSAATAAATVDLDQSRVGRLSRMDALQNQAISQSALAMRTQEIRQTQAALRRLDNGVYGLCVQCEEDIDPRRLNHNPAASMCVECAEKAEL